MTWTGIPTTYAGVNFRSRLEARWAALFNMLGIDWAYEPVDMPGWIPDFRIGHRLYEIKPATTVEGLIEHAPKICAAIDEHHANLGHLETTSVGLIGEILPSDGSIGVMITSHGGTWLPLLQLFIASCAKCLRPSVVADDCFGCCTFCYGMAGMTALDLSLPALWKQAGNIVRWEPTTKREVR